MKTPAQEAFAQLMFWSGIGCLPLSVALAILGFNSKNKAKAMMSFFMGAVAFTHFLWFFNYLGRGLAHKVGRFEAPSWYSFVPYSLVGFALLIGLWSVFDTRRAPVSPPPLP